MYSNNKIISLSSFVLKISRVKVDQSLFKKTIINFFINSNGKSTIKTAKNPDFPSDPKEFGYCRHYPESCYSIISNQWKTFHGFSNTYVSSHFRVCVHFSLCQHNCQIHAIYLYGIHCNYDNCLVIDHNFQNGEIICTN